MFVKYLTTRDSRKKNKKQKTKTNSPNHLNWQAIKTEKSCGKSKN